MYPPQAVIAEKLHAMVVLDIRNSRMKDFYDLWYLSRAWSFRLSTLREAIHATFDCRRTAVPAQIPFALTDGFLRNETKTQQWLGFLRRLHLETSTPDLQEVGRQIAALLEPTYSKVSGELMWRTGGPWE